MTGSSRIKQAFLLAVIFLLLVCLPYLYAAAAGGVDFVFGGFLLNPIDGNSYLAKMYQGWRGEWQFQLPYTAEQGEGAYLFIFYLFLGHVARNLGLSLPVTFHLARLLAAGLLLISLFRFFEDSLGQSSKLAFLLAIFGSGLGWLATLFGLFTADFWVAEAYPFLSAYANPHFPLALALMLAALTRISNRECRSGWFQMALYAISGFILALILPFGIVLVVLLLLVLWIWRAADLIGQGERVSQIIFAPEAVRRGLALAAGGAPVLLYYLWAVNSNSQLAAWNAQNLTPSPPWWDVLLAFSPALPVALLGAWWAWRASDASLRVLLVWLILGLVMLALPIGLQRRFILGYFIPLAGLAAYAVSQIKSSQRSWRKLFSAGLILLSIPTNFVILLTALFGIQTHDAQIYLERAEVQAFDWIRAETEQDALILAAPDTGLLIPAYTGRRVIYGHPFETVDAEQRKGLVESVFQGKKDWTQLEIAQPIDYVFYGPRESELGSLSTPAEWSIAWETEGLTIYQVLP